MNSFNASHKYELSAPCSYINCYYYYYYYYYYDHHHHRFTALWSLFGTIRESWHQKLFTKQKQKLTTMKKAYSSTLSTTSSYV